MASKRKKANKEAAGFMQFIFGLVAGSLLRFGDLLGLSYNQMNVVLYYGLIPLSWFFMGDRIVGGYYSTIAFIVFCAGVRVAIGNRFRVWCDGVFEKSVKFLLYFDRFGSNYTASSVWICVAIPLIIYGVLGYLLLAHVPVI